MCLAEPGSEYMANIFVSRCTLMQHKETHAVDDPYISTSATCVNVYSKTVPGLDKTLHSKKN
jgi:hypothetical protein